MLVLLDANLPHRLRKLLSDHDVRTAAHQGWAHLSNGDLIAAAEGAGFHVLVTADQNMPYQQNIGAHRLSVIVLSSNELEPVTEAIETIRAAIGCAVPGTFVEMDFSAGADA